MNDFFKNKKDKPFFEPFDLKPKIYIVIIVFINGNIVEETCVNNPWAFINTLKKNPKIKTAYIKSD